MTPRQLGRFSWVSRFTGPGAATLAQSLRAVRVGGRISIIGVLSGVQTTIPITAILMSAVRLQGILVGHRESFEARCQSQMVLLALITAPRVVAKILDQLRIPSTPPPLAPARQATEPLMFGDELDQTDPFAAIVKRIMLTLGHFLKYRIVGLAGQDAWCRCYPGKRMDSVAQSHR